MISVFQSAEVGQWAIAIFPFFGDILFFFTFQCSQCFPFIIRCYIQIPHCRVYALMPKKKTDLCHIHAIFQPVCGFCMAESVGMDIKRHIPAFFMGRCSVFFNALINRRFCKLFMFSANAGIKQVGFRIRLFTMKYLQIGLNMCRRPWKQICSPCFAAFPSRLM